MPTLYCPRSECAAKVAYEAIKPTVCPRCNKPFAAAFKVAASTAPVVVATSLVRVPRPVAVPVVKAAAKWKVARLRREPAKPFAVDAEIDAQYGVEDTVDAGGDDGPIYRPEVAALAQELAASIDPSTISIGDNDEGVFRFSDMWREGTTARESGPVAAPKPAVKRKTRR